MSNRPCRTVLKLCRGVAGDIGDLVLLWLVYSRRSPYNASPGAVLCCAVAEEKGVDCVRL